MTREEFLKVVSERVEYYNDILKESMEIDVRDNWFKIVHKDHLSGPFLEDFCALARIYNISFGVFTHQDGGIELLV